MNRRAHIWRGFTLGLLSTFLLTYAPLVVAEQRYPASGLVVRVDPAHKVAVISCNPVPGYMEAMTMPLSVHQADELNNLSLGTMVDFTLVVSKGSAFAESVHTRVYQGLEPDPAAARRLKLLAKATGNSAKPLTVGDPVPDFTLSDQSGEPITLSRFRGKVVVLDFVYTRCALPNFCVRSTNNFGALQKRFGKVLATRLVLMTVTFDPIHDTPDALRKYAAKFGADPKGWYFLTGSEVAIRKVSDLFGEDYFPDEGLMDHSLHTAIITREGKLAANLEGNEFTAKQLGDLVQVICHQAQP
jgi:protein SCO1